MKFLTKRLSLMGGFLCFGNGIILAITSSSIITSIIGYIMLGIGSSYLANIKQYND